MSGRFVYSSKRKSVADSIAASGPALKFSLYVFLLTGELLLNAAAGAAAAATGAHANGRRVEKAALRAGALGGIMKVGITSVAHILAATQGSGFRCWLLLNAGGWAATMGTTAALCAVTLGQVPREFLAAAAVTSIVLSSACIMERFHQPDSRLVAFVSPAYYATAGAIFAAMASREGIYISSTNAAGAAGAVFGTVFLVGRIPCDLVLGHKNVRRRRGYELYTFVRMGEPPESAVQGDATELPIRERTIWDAIYRGLDRLLTRLWVDSIEVEDNSVGFEVPSRTVEPTPEELEEARAARDAEERRRDRGHQVWFSRPRGVSQYVHFVLTVNGKKYELRAQGRRPRYVHGDSPIDVSRREVYREQASYVGDYSVYLIGWTRMTDTEIDAVCRRLCKSWAYYLWWPFGGKKGNCQQFLRIVAKEIIPKSHRALDWHWFANGVYGPTELSIMEDAQAYQRIQGDAGVGSTSANFAEQQSITQFGPFHSIGSSSVEVRHDAF